MGTAKKIATRGGVLITLAWLVASIAIGATATAGIAWWCAWRNPMAAGPIPSYSGPGIYEGTVIGFTRTDPYVGCESLRWVGWGGATIQKNLSPGVTLALHQDKLPYWSRISPISGDPYVDSPEEWISRVLAVENGYGWPWTTMSSLTHNRSLGPYTTRENIGIEIDPGKFRLPHLLPTAIVWRGFLASTAMIACVVMMILPVVVLVRHRRRLARGACVACGYDMAGVPVAGAGGRVCPECGTVRE